MVVYAILGDRVTCVPFGGGFTCDHARDPGLVASAWHWFTAGGMFSPYHYVIYFVAIIGVSMRYEQWAAKRPFDLCRKRGHDKCGGTVAYDGTRAIRCKCSCHVPTRV